ncbi:BrnA antitoxin family protein [uncultured Thiodictyon sp.]|uniref:BrnA antitoxin family protein n=1 Tax=uncultured Thiodictyon sp. TaxID=1846217 RepID=UPI0025E7D841|nr:BrnA antitoxin family protein [uncultured Thiodictyon sp.]
MFDWGGIPAVRAALAARSRGPQRAPTKVPTKIRFDADALAALKTTGRGWQTRANDAMREWLKEHSPPDTGTHR